MNGGVSKKRKRLKDIRLHEVSLVDKPANPGARVVLLKRADDASTNEGDAVKVSEILKSGGKGLDRDQVYRALRARAVELHPNEQISKAAVSYMRSEEGRRLMSVYNAAPKPKFEPPEPAKPHVAKALDGDLGKAIEATTRAAVEIMKADPGKFPGIAQARIEARRRDPALQVAEDKERRARRREQV